MQQHAQQISEHMEIVGSDGGHVGTVDKVEGDRIKLTKKDDPDGTGAHHHYLPLGAVASVSGNQVRLNTPAQQAKQAAVGGGLDKSMGAQAGVTGAGTMQPGQMDMAADPIPSMGGTGGGGGGVGGTMHPGGGSGTGGRSPGG